MYFDCILIVHNAFQINGKRGYALKRFLRESKVLVKDLQYTVPVNPTLETEETPEPDDSVKNEETSEKQSNTESVETPEKVPNSNDVLLGAEDAEFERMKQAIPDRKKEEKVTENIEPKDENDESPSANEVDEENEEGEEEDTEDEDGDDEEDGEESEEGEEGEELDNGNEEADNESATEAESKNEETTTEKESLKTDSPVVIEKKVEPVIETVLSDLVSQTIEKVTEVPLSISPSESSQNYEVIDGTTLYFDDEVPVQEEPKTAENPNSYILKASKMSDIEAEISTDVPLPTEASFQSSVQNNQNLPTDTLDQVISESSTAIPKTIEESTSEESLPESEIDPAETVDNTWLPSLASFFGSDEVEDESETKGQLDDALQESLKKEENKEIKDSIKEVINDNETKELNNDELENVAPADPEVADPVKKEEENSEIIKDQLSSENDEISKSNQETLNQKEESSSSFDGSSTTTEESVQSPDQLPSPGVFSWFSSSESSEVTEEKPSEELSNSVTDDVEDVKKDLSSEMKLEEEHSHTSDYFTTTESYNDVNDEIRTETSENISVDSTESPENEIKEHMSSNSMYQSSSSDIPEVIIPQNADIVLENERKNFGKLCYFLYHLYRVL